MRSVAESTLEEGGRLGGVGRPHPAGPVGMRRHHAGIRPPPLRRIQAFERPTVKRGRLPREMGEHGRPRVPHEPLV